MAADADTNTSLGNRSGEGSTPFTGLAQTPDANLFTGAMMTSVSIEIPAGRQNATPKLALQYSSSDGQSIYGYGWDLPLGRVQRSTKWGVPRCGSNSFILSLPSGTVELVADPPGSSTYRPVVEENYLDAEKDEAQNSWTVYDKAGIKYVFGDRPSARVGNDTTQFMGPTDESGHCVFTTAWGLTHIEDPDGNSIDLSYLASGNVLYPASVNYGGNSQAGLAHFYHVIFSYERRPDTVENDLGGASVLLALRLSSIGVATDVPSFNQFRIYTFDYDNEPGGNGVSRLIAVSATGYPTQYFAYADSTYGATSAQSSAPASALRATNGSGEVWQTLLDMNGDGIVDIVQAGQPTWTVYFGTGAAFNPGTPWYLPTPGDMSTIRDVYEYTQPCEVDAGWPCTDRDTFDITGDGIPDFVDARPTPWLVYPGVCGATIRGDGKAILILDMSALIDVVTGSVSAENVFRRTA